MSGLQVIDGYAFEEIEEIARRRLQGDSETKIAKDLGIPRKVVIERWNTYREILAEDAGSRDAARDQLHQMVKHYDDLIKRSYEILRNLELLPFDEKVANQMNAVLKSIASYEATRTDHMAKAGLLDAGDLGDELAEMEEKQEILINILRNDLCPDCRARVAFKIQQVSNQPEVIDVEVNNG